VRIALGPDRILRVIDIRPGKRPDEDPAPVVEAAEEGETGLGCVGTLHGPYRPTGCISNCLLGVLPL
jgi:hypothetical protein